MMSLIGVWTAQRCFKLDASYRHGYLNTASSQNGFFYGYSNNPSFSQPSKVSRPEMAGNQTDGEPAESGQRSPAVEAEKIGKGGEKKSE